MNTRILPLIMLATLPLAPVYAQSGATTNPAQVESGTYAIDPQHTQVLFAVSHMGFTTYYGRFSDASGVLNLSAKDPAASSLEVQVPTSTVSTTS